MEKIIILGFGGHAHSVIDSIESGKQYEIAGLIAPDLNEDFSYSGYKIIGSDDDLQEIYRQGIRNACVGIGYLGRGHVREKLYEQLKCIGYKLPVIIDPTAIVSHRASIQEGAYIGKHTIVNAGAEVGEMAIINSGAILEHDVQVGSFSHVAISTVLCGEVTVGNRCLIGANATVIQCRKIGNDVVVGAGAVVRKDIEDDVTFYE